MNRKFIRTAAVVFVIGLAAGCGSAGPSLVPVHGRLTLDGKPLVGKTLKFVPEKGTPGLGGGGTTNAEGQYTALADRPGATRDIPGLPPGAYRVVVTEPMFPLEMPTAAADTDSGAPPPAMGLPSPTKKKVQEIPPVYGNVTSTLLRVEVPEGGGMINLAMEGPPKK